MKEVKKNQRGITLVALVVTIVVLLILAGVTIALVMNNNGIVNRATEARDQSGTGNVRELVSVALMSTQADYFVGKVQSDALATSFTAELSGVGLTVKDTPAVTLSVDPDTKAFTGSATVILNGYEYKVTVDTSQTTLETKIAVPEGTKVVAGP